MDGDLKSRKDIDADHRKFGACNKRDNKISVAIGLKNLLTRGLGLHFANCTPSILWLGWQATHTQMSPKKAGGVRAVPTVRIAPKRAAVRPHVATSSVPVPVADQHQDNMDGEDCTCSFTF